MPTKREREYYRMGFKDGIESTKDKPFPIESYLERSRPFERKPKKRKLSAWNKYVKANSKKPRFRYRNGKLNLKKMAIAFRKTPAGRKSKRR